MTERAPQIDFAALAASLLERADTLVPQWLPSGRKQGRYWYVGDFDGQPGKSANVNLATGKWGDNGGGPADRGADLLSLYKRVRGHATMLAAARELQADMGWRAAPVASAQQKARKAVQWSPVHPVPPFAPPYDKHWAHYSRGAPHAHWEYRDRDGRLLGVVVRHNTSDGGKEVSPLSFAVKLGTQMHAWRYVAFAQPRPLYGLQRLGPSTQPVPPRVIVVEGEKKADALYEALGREVPVLAWPGGCKVVHLADWSVLPEGTQVLAWPDADAQRDKAGNLLPAERQPGLAAMRKLAETLDRQGVLVRIVDTGPPGTQADGWDAADAIASGWTRAQLEAFMGRVLPEGAPPADRAPESPPAGGGSGGASTPSDAAQGSAGDGGPPGERWQDRFIMARGSIRECVANVALVLQEHAAWAGVLGFDDFAQRVVKRAPAPYDPPGLECPAEWSDTDDTETAIWISRTCGFVPGSALVAEAANVSAHRSPFHPVRDWLGTLRHDGTERVDLWLSDYLGVVDTPYTRKVARYFLVGMCMRVLKPGCKFDYCLVLEGGQGKGKSTSFRVLGGEWFSDTELDLAHKDSMSYIRGKWLHEFGELGSLARSEEMRQKSFLSRQVDEFRPTYGRREIRCSRQVAFGGTTNQWQWNKDPTGGRRFWPVEVGEIDHAALASAREQLFAEAFALAKAGERYWPDADEQRELFDPEQLTREAPDAYVDLLASWLADKGNERTEFSLATACMEGLKLDAKALTKDVQTRVGIALRKLECERVERRNAPSRFMYKRPTRKAASSVDSSPAQQEEGVPF